MDQTSEDNKKSMIQLIDELNELKEEYRQKTFENNSLKAEVYDLEVKVEKLKSEVADLECQIDDLEYEESLTSLDDRYKIEYFKEYKDYFTPWSLEKLFQFGVEIKKTR